MGPADGLAPWAKFGKLITALRRDGADPVRKSQTPASSRGERWLAPNCACSADVSLNRVLILVCWAASTE